MNCPVDAHAPFLLKPAEKDYLWGGSRLKEEYGKEGIVTPLAESWECSVHPDGESVVASGVYQGETLSRVLAYHPAYLGERHRKKGVLPILVKLIDAKEDLSVQVHPDDRYAALHENGQQGKTEMWYVLDAAKDATLICGVSHDTTAAQIRRALEEGRIMDFLQRIPVRRDDVFYIPAGTIHAIGAGCLIAEIQQSSNLTYRLHDYDRRDKDGQRRALHIDKALDVAVLKARETPRQPLRVLRYRAGGATELLARCPYFEVHRMLVRTDGEGRLAYGADALSFRVLLCIEGAGSLFFREEALVLKKGDCVFVPADTHEIGLAGAMQLLDIRT